MKEKEKAGMLMRNRSFPQPFEQCAGKPVKAAGYQKAASISWALCQDRVKGAFFFF